MANSQFTIYSYQDANGPGVIYGAAGDLLRVLDLILVNGYTGKTAAGWSKPIANASNCGCYKPASGARQTLYVNDNGSNVTSTFKEAWVTGWESITAVTSPVGTGVGQFPLPSQQLTTGHGVVRKSATADGTTGRAWIAFADAYTLYLFISPGDTFGTYNGNLFFGDIFSLGAAADAFRTILVAAAGENSSTIGSSTLNGSDYIGNYNAGTNVIVGHWMPRTFGGQGTSIQVMKQGDMSKTALATSGAMLGSVQTPNGPDTCLYVSAVSVVEFGNFCIRGRMRGMYHICHPTINFIDGQIFQGGSDVAGKTFQIVKPGAQGGFWGIETSATVETN